MGSTEPTSEPIRVGDRVAFTYLTQKPLLGWVTNIRVTMGITEYCCIINSGDFRWIVEDHVTFLYTAKEASRRED